MQQRLPSDPLHRAGRGRLGAAVVVGLVLASAGCAFDDTTRWTDQRAPSGPCWEVDLGDGLDEESIREFHLLFDCFAEQGVLTEFSDLVAALDRPTRAGIPATRELAAEVNALVFAGWDFAGLARELAATLEAAEGTVQAGAQVAVELAYGRPYGAVAATGANPDSAALDAGLLVPMVPIADGVLDLVLRDPAPVAVLADALDDPRTGDLVCTAVAMHTSEDPVLQATIDDLPRNLATALGATRSPENDHWTGATGDSFRDLFDALRRPTGSGRTWHTLRGPAEPILRDDALIQRLRPTLVELAENGDLAPVAAQLRYLATVDSTGATIRTGESSADRDTALTALLRLLTRANQPMVCTVDLGLIDFDTDLGNLATALLRLVASQDPDTIESVVGLLGTLLDAELSRSLLDELAESGACPPLDEDLVQDLLAVDRLNDPAARELLHVAIEVLSDFAPETGDDHIDDLVDLIGTAHEGGLSEPLGEVLRDLGDGRLAADLVSVLPILAQPELLDATACPTATAPLSFTAAMGLVEELLLDADADAASRLLEPVASLVLEDDRTWALLDPAISLVAEESAVTATLPSTLMDTVVEAGSLEVLGDAAALLRDEQRWARPARILEVDTVQEAAVRTSNAAPGPIPTLAGWVLDGTLDTILRTVASVLDLLGAPGRDGSASDGSATER